MTGQFKRYLKRYKYETTKLEDLKNILHYLQEAGTVPQRYKPHRLSGEYKDCMECHIISWNLQVALYQGFTS